jgi:hypothetical protein
MDSSDDDQITKPKTTAKSVTKTQEPVQEQKEPKPKKTYARKAKEVVANTLKGNAKGKQAKTQKDVLSELECDLEREEALLQRLEEKAAKRKALQAEIRKPNIPTSEADSESEVEEPEPPKKVKPVKEKKVIKKVVEPEPETDSESDVSIIEEIIVKKKKKPKAEPKPKKKKVVRKIIEVSDSENDTGSDSDGTPPQPTARVTKSQQNRVTKVIPQLPQSKYYFA